MTRWFAFLRGINLGKRRVKMERLRAIFRENGYRSVETYIASGNVIFESDAGSRTRLQSDIEALLQSELGYEVMTVLRTNDDLREIVARMPFHGEMTSPEVKVHVNFLTRAPAADAHDRLAALATPYDSFAIEGEQAYWLTRGRLSDSRVELRDLERALGDIRGTMRNFNTVQALATRYSDG